MFTHDDFRGAERVGCGCMILLVLLVLASVFMLGRCTAGKRISVNVETTNQVEKEASKQ